MGWKLLPVDFKEEDGSFCQAWILYSLNWEVQHLDAF